MVSAPEPNALMISVHLNQILACLQIRALAWQLLKNWLFVEAMDSWAQEYASQLLQGAGMLPPLGTLRFLEIYDPFLLQNNYDAQNISDC